MDSASHHIKPSSDSNHTNSICPEILIKNQKSIEFIKSITSTISGSLAGILALTNLHGFLFYIFTSFLTSSLIWFITHLKSKSIHSIYLHSTQALWFNSLIDNLFSFILWWTLFYALIHS
ncbi:hypothetical protein DFH28DRAFT_208602 [Melampsora americana]|nr:hypothetical protein DFH28DRAFT_208602 [Melampsora americana]